MSSCSTWGGLKSERLFFAPADIAGLFFWCEYSSSLFSFLLSFRLSRLISFCIFSFPIILWSLSFSLFPSLAFSLFLWTTYYPAESKGIGQLCIQTWMIPNRYIYSSTMIWVTGAQPVLHWNNQLWARMHNATAHGNEPSTAFLVSHHTPLSVQNPLLTFSLFLRTA